MNTDKESYCLYPCSSVFIRGYFFLVAPASAGHAPLAAAGAIFARTGFVDVELAAVTILTVQGVDGRLGFLAVVHFDKAETLGAAGVPVHDDLGRTDRAVRFKQILQIGVGHPVGEISD